MEASSAKHIAMPMLMILRRIQERMLAGPASLAPRAGRKKIPVPMMLFIAMSRRAL